MSEDIRHGRASQKAQCRARMSSFGWLAAAAERRFARKLPADSANMGGHPETRDLDAAAA